MSSAPLFFSPFRNTTFVTDSDGFDIAFSKTWSHITPYVEKKKRITTDTFLEVLEMIHQLIISHLPRVRYRFYQTYVLEEGVIKQVKNTKIEPVRGKALARSFYAFNRGEAFSEEGLIRLIQNIYKGKEKAHLIIQMSDGAKYTFSAHSITITPPQPQIIKYYDEGHIEVEIPREESIVSEPSEDPKEVIARLISNIYPDITLVKYKRDDTSAEREEASHVITKRYFERLSSTASDEGKLHLIAKLVQQLMRLHLYQVGNEETFVMMTNLLLGQHGLPLSYPPTSDFLFGNSPREIATLLKEHPIPREISSLNDYCRGIETLEALITKTGSDHLTALFSQRNFSQLFLLSTQNPSYHSLSVVLYKYRAALHVNIYVHNETHQNALDLAITCQNAQATLFLKKIGMIPLQLLKREMAKKLSASTLSDEERAPLTQLLQEWKLQRLWEESAKNEHCFKLTKFLTKYKAHLGIDISTLRGESSLREEITLLLSQTLLLDELLSSLEALVNTKGLQELRDAFLERNFEQVFRLSAQYPHCTDILMKISNNHEALHVNIHSCSKKSGNALDIAIEHQNSDAIQLLENVGLKPTRPLLTLLETLITELEGTDEEKSLLKSLLEKRKMTNLLKEALQMAKAAAIVDFLVAHHETLMCNIALFTSQLPH